MVFHHIRRLSVSTNDLPNVQDISYRDLSYVQDIFYHDLSNVQDVSYRNLPNVQNEPYHDSLSERDEPFQSEYCLLASVMFSQNISASRADTHVKCSQVLLANLVHFGLSSVQQIVHILSQRVSRCWLLLTGRLVPFLNLLVPFLSNVCTIFGSRIHINTSFEIVSVDNRRVSTYTLLAVVYYADQHFTAQSSPVTGELGYYDGLALINPNVQPILEEVGSIHCKPDLQSC